MNPPPNPMPTIAITGPRERDGLHERETAAVVVKTGWGAGLMVRRTFCQEPSIGAHGFVIPPAWWVWCETSHRWRLCEPAGMFTAHAGDAP